MLKELIDTYEELKKYVFIINRGTKKPIIIKFNDDNFYHLVGLHKININLFFPKYIKSKAKKYKYLKKNINKFNNIIINQLQEKETLSLRMHTFKYIIDLLKNTQNTILYDLHQTPKGSMYKGDYGLLKVYQDFNCLLGLITESETESLIFCLSQSWMASYKSNRLIENKRAQYIQNISIVPMDMFNKKENK